MPKINQSTSHTTIKQNSDRNRNKKETQGNMTGEKEKKQKGNDGVGGDVSSKVVIGERGSAEEEKVIGMSGKGVEGVKGDGKEDLDADKNGDKANGNGDNVEGNGDKEKAKNGRNKNENKGKESDGEILDVNGDKAGGNGETKKNNEGNERFFDRNQEKEEEFARMDENFKEIAVNILGKEGNVFDKVVECFKQVFKERMMMMEEGHFLSQNKDLEYVVTFPKGMFHFSKRNTIRTIL